MLASEVLQNNYLFLSNSANKYSVKLKNWHIVKDYIFHVCIIQVNFSPNQFLNYIRTQVHCIPMKEPHIRRRAPRNQCPGRRILRNQSPERFKWGYFLCILLEDLSTVKFRWNALSLIDSIISFSMKPAMCWAEPIPRYLIIVKWDNLPQSWRPSHQRGWDRKRGKARLKTKFMIIEPFCIWTICFAFLWEVWKQTR